MTDRNPAREALSRAVNRAITEGAPVITEKPAPHVTHTAATLAAYRMFADWRRTVLDAGFIAKGPPLGAYRALDRLLFRNEGDRITALCHAETALLAWQANHAVDIVADVLTLVQQELADLRTERHRLGATP